MNTITASSPSYNFSSKPLVSHLAYLDGLRAFAALYVLIHHAVLQLNVDDNYPYFARVISSIFQHGRFAVDFFIVISGFCLALPIINNNGVFRNGPIEFLKRRAIRILPTYYIALTLSIILALTYINKKTGTNWDNSIPVTKFDLFTHSILIQDFFSETMFKINHTYWSISVEWYIYLLFPFVVLIWKKFGPVITTISSLFISLLLWLVLGKTDLNVYGMSPHYLSLFCFGMLAAQISFRRVNLINIFLVILSAILAFQLHPILKPDLIAGMCAASLLVIVGFGELNIIRNLFSCRPLAFIGTFAYSIYLIHAPLLQVFSQLFLLRFTLSAGLSFYVLLLVGVPLILFCSYLFFLFAEKPFLNSKRIQTNYISNK